MHRHGVRGQDGFTLIEVVVIIAVLGIIASVAIPRYQDITNEVKESTARANLAAVREAIHQYYLAEVARTGTGLWPTLAQLRRANTVLQGTIPANPYVAKDRQPTTIINGNIRMKGWTNPNRGGWVYKASTGQIWLNSTTNAANTW